MGSKRIKGITIEIDGNTSKLQTALRDVDSSLSKTQSSLRDVNRLLKFDPKNTELLTQKQNLLKQSISETKDRLNTLKNAEKQVQQAFLEGKVSEEQYNALKREIVETESKLKSLEKTLANSTPRLDALANGAKNVGDKMTSVGKKLMPVSAGIAGIGIASGKMAVEFEDNMANINTLLDDTKHLQGYEDAIVDLSNETGISLDIVSSGMYQTISSIGDGGKATEQMFKIMGKSAKAGGAEVSDSVALISAGMKGYNSVSEETAQKISDLAFETAKLGVTTFPEMARSMQPLFPLASSLNMSYEELFGTMATLTGVTGNTSEVTTQFKAVMSNLMKPTEAMNELLRKYGYESGAAMIQSEGLQGVLQILQQETGGQSDKLAQLFSSTEALTAITALTGPQMDVFGEKLLAMGECAGATETAYGKMNTQGDQMRKTINEAKNTAVELGSALMETLAPIIDAVSNKISQFTAWFKSLSDEQKQTIVTIGLVVGALGPLLVIAGSVAGGISKLITLTGTVIKVAKHVPALMTTIGGGAKALWGIISANPIGALITTIGILVTAFVTAYNKCEWFRDGVNKIFGGVVSFIKSAIDKIKGFFDFSWELPKIKLPHISIKGKFSLAPPSVPSFGIKWYKKAMNKFYELKNANVFGSMGGQLLGGGEAGSEMVVGKQHMLDMIRQATAMNNVGIVNAIGIQTKSLLAGMESCFARYCRTKVVLDSGTLVGELAPGMDKKFGNIATWKERGM